MWESRKKATQEYNIPNAYALLPAEMLFVKDETNPMPQKPLEAILQTFKEKQIKLFNRTPQDESVQLGMLSEHMIREVWSAALEYAVECLPPEDKPKWGSENFETYQTYANGFNDCLAKTRIKLLEESDKAVKGV